MDDPEISPDSLEAEFPTWEAWRGVDRRWWARIRGVDPPVMVVDDDLDGLREEIIRRQSQLDAQAWAKEQKS